MIGQWFSVPGIETQEMGRKEEGGLGGERDGVTFVSTPRAGCLLTMDTVGYSKWDGRLEEVPGGMSNGAASQVPLGPSLTCGLGFDGRMERISQERA